MSQTVTKNVNATQMGSALFEISTDGIAWTNLGAMRGVVFTETFDRVEIFSDNAGKIRDYKKNQKASLAGDLLELSLADLNTLRGGMDTYTTDAGVSETLSTGGLSTINAIQCRATNTNERNEIFRITVYKAINNKGIVIAFGSDEADDVNSIPIELIGSEDVTLTPGAQLCEFYNEQGIGGVNS